MKVIIIKDCLSCPFSDINDPDNNGGNLVCELSVKGKFRREICEMIAHKYEIPEWCPLDDYEKFRSILE